MGAFGTLKVMLMFLVFPLMGDAGLDLSSNLNSINKTPVKSIKSPDGDIIDCIHTAKQVAFDHPLLKNHKIQMRPSSHPQGILRDESSKKEIRQLWQLNGECPQGTIPVRRTTEEDILRSGSFSRKNHLPPPITNLQSHEHAGVSAEGGKYYGAKATINLWEPYVEQPNEFSLAQFWLLAGSYASRDLNSIEAGWQVYPGYGTQTRLFVYWTRDAYQYTGCYNLLCPGFIQTSNEIAVGAAISPVSSYGGSQYNITLLVFKDQKDGNWWLQLGDGSMVGYWPASLFTHLADSATLVQWGGEIVNLQSEGQHTTTQMGSGRFPNEGFGKSSYFKNIQVVDGSNNLRIPTDIYTFEDKPNCYKVQIAKDSNGAPYFFFGGPGRNPNCP